MFELQNLRSGQYGNETFGNVGNGRIEENTCGFGKDGVPINNTNHIMTSLIQKTKWLPYCLMLMTVFTIFLVFILRDQPSHQAITESQSVTLNKCDGNASSTLNTEDLKSSNATYKVFLYDAVKLDLDDHQTCEIAERDETHNKGCKLAESGFICIYVNELQNSSKADLIAFMNSSSEVFRCDGRGGCTRKCCNSCCTRSKDDGAWCNFSICDSGKQTKPGDKSPAFMVTCKTSKS
ncbi:Hypothetical predicted protein [Cloeon dipterum]|uniref:Uncharacterized protein n=1 Tax=Cloeon dipterum TaxID=197152 RepID=A0A8S1C9D4_9INSE|nr:Hypothetical predicted protein [Cloeon dipterum]